MSKGETQEAAHPQTIKQRLNFRDDNRALHLQLLYEWLAPDLRDAPFIDWSRLPSKVIGYLIKTVGTSLFAGPLALAVGVLCGAVSEYNLWIVTARLNHLLRHLQEIGMAHGMRNET